jgi:hypothetical protein
MTRVNNNPILRAVNSAIGFPTIENLLCDGHAVNFRELKDALGDRLIIEDRKLCMSHVRSIATSIVEFKAVLIPLTVEQKDNNYLLIDGYHRVAALNLIKGSLPDMDISVKVIINK